MVFWVREMAGVLKTWTAVLLLGVLLLSPHCTIASPTTPSAPPRRFLSKVKHSIDLGIGEIHMQLSVQRAPPDPRSLILSEGTISANDGMRKGDEDDDNAERKYLGRRHLLQRPAPPGTIPVPPTPRFGPPGPA